MDDLYPTGHPPYLLARDVHECIHDIAAQPSWTECLRQSSLGAWMIAWHLEILRAELFRSEQLATAEALPERDDPRHLGQIGQLPDNIRLALKAMKAAQQCFEAWLESPTCLEIQAKYPRQTPAKGE